MTPLPSASAICSDGPLGRRVLVADDNRDAADTLAVVLRSLGHEVSTVYDGPQALAMAIETLPQVLVLDIAMPGMDGYEVARRLRQIPACMYMGLIAVTGWKEFANKKEANEAGFDEHLTKPADPYELSALIFRHALAGARL